MKKCLKLLILLLTAGCQDNSKNQKLCPHSLPQEHAVPLVEDSADDRYGADTRAETPEGLPNARDMQKSSLKAPAETAAVDSNIELPGIPGDPPNIIGQLTRGANKLIITHEVYLPDGTHRTLLSTTVECEISDWANLFALKMLPLVRYLKVTTTVAGDPWTHIERRLYTIDNETGAIDWEERDNCECGGEFTFRFFKGAKQLLSFGLAHDIFIKCKTINYDHDSELTESSAKAVKERLKPLLERAYPKR